MTLPAIDLSRGLPNADPAFGYFPVFERLVPIELEHRFMHTLATPVVQDLMDTLRPGDPFASSFPGYGPGLHNAPKDQTWASSSK